jgi:hypothetical protein
MAHVLEQELVCTICGKIEPISECCGTDMEFDGFDLFCAKCGRENRLPFCCSKHMIIKKKIRNIKKELFSTSF